MKDSEVKGEPKQRLFDAIREVIDAIDGVRLAKEEYAHVYSLIGGPGAMVEGEFHHTAFRR